jgi:IS5 family transposase
MSNSDFFRSRMDHMIDLRHPLAVLATRLPWASIEAAVASKLAHQANRTRSSSIGSARRSSAGARSWAW